MLFYFEALFRNRKEQKDRKIEKPHLEMFNVTLTTTI